jgi:general secretion pathway protein D
MSRRLTLLILMILLGPIAAVHAENLLQPAKVETSPGSTFLLNARDVEIAVFADDVATVTGRTLILDPAVRGKVTVISQEPLDADGVWTLFQSVLRVQGFAAIRSGDSWRIIPQAEARQGGPISGSAGARDADLVTRLIRLDNLAATEAATALKPFLSASGSVEPFSRPNSLIVTGYADDISRVEALLRQLDGGASDSMAVIQLSNASAPDAAAMLERLLGGAGKGPSIAADVRSNQLFVRGNQKELDEARRLASDLDKGGGAAVTTRVFRLSNSDAEAVIEVLRGAVGAGAPATNPVARSLVDNDRPTYGGGYATLASNPATGGAEASGRFDSEANQAATGFGIGGADSELSLQAATDINAIVVRGTSGQIAEVEGLIEDLDVRRPQVVIEAAIVEITGDAAEQFGVQLGIGDAAPGGGAAAVSFSDQGLSLRRILSILGAPVATALTEDGLSAGIGVNDDFGILVQAFGSSTKANLLSTPSITTLDNQPAEIVVGQNVPFRTGSFTTTGNSTNPFTTIEREDVGITLRVSPRIYDGDVVRLDVSQEVSSLVNSVVPGASDLITNRRSIQTTVLADNGSVVVLGGLITDDRISVESKVPLLGDVPVVGNLFKNTSESGTRRTLFVFLRPTIIRSREELDQLAADRMQDLNQASALLENRESLLISGRNSPRVIGIDQIY